MAHGEPFEDIVIYLCTSRTGLAIVAILRLQCVSAVGRHNLRLWVKLGAATVWGRGNHVNDARLGGERGMRVLLEPSLELPNQCVYEVDQSQSARNALPSVNVRIIVITIDRADVRKSHPCPHQAEANNKSNLPWTGLAGAGGLYIH